MPSDKTPSHVCGHYRGFPTQKFCANSFFFFLHLGNLLTRAAAYPARSRTRVMPSELSASSGLTTTGGASDGASPRAQHLPGRDADAGRGHHRLGPRLVARPAPSRPAGCRRRGCRARRTARGRWSCRAGRTSAARRRRAAAWSGCATASASAHGAAAAAIGVAAQVGREAPAPVGRDVGDVELVAARVGGGVQAVPRRRAGTGRP